VNSVANLSLLTDTNLFLNEKRKTMKASKRFLPYIISALLFAFGLLTLFLTSSVIFDLFGIRAKEGNYVLFVVWANFVSSLLYIFSAYGMIKFRKWTFHLLAISSLVLIVAFLGFLIYISSGVIHETKTIGAMIFRILVTLGFTTFAFFINRKKYNI
jgi:hypothetical protein